MAQLAPVLAEATKSDDGKVSNGAWTLLRMLGPEAGGALTTLRSLAHDSKEAAAPSAAVEAIKSICVIDRLKDKEASVRCDAALTLGRLGWPATSGLPALIALLEDPEKNVRVAAANSLRSLGRVSESAVSPLAAALRSELDPMVRAAIVEALEAIAPGSPAVLDAHVAALRDPDPAGSKGGRSVHEGPGGRFRGFGAGNRTWRSERRSAPMVAGSLTEILFQNPAVIPALLKALREDAKRKAVLALCPSTSTRHRSRLSSIRSVVILSGSRPFWLRRFPRLRKPFPSRTPTRDRWASDSWAASSPSCA